MDRQLLSILVAPLARKWIDVAGVVDSPKVKVYPDLSLWIADQAYCDRAMSHLNANAFARPAAATFRALSPFGRDIYNLFYPGDYGQMLMQYDELGLGIGPASGRLPTEDEKSLQQLFVVVTLYRRVSK